MEGNIIVLDVLIPPYERVMWICIEREQNQHFHASGREAARGHNEILKYVIESSAQNIVLYHE